MFARKECLSVLVVLTAFAVGCGGSGEDPRGQRVAVWGTVTMDGEPLPGGRIVFESNQGSGQVKAIATIANGEFEFDARNGPLAGKATVRIFSREPELEEFDAALQGDAKAAEMIELGTIPPRYNSESQLQAEIVSDGGESKPLSFELTSE